MSRSICRGCSFVFLTVLAGMSAARFAAAGDALEEIVVTAQKRAESLQDVPMSISAITAETMQRADISTFIDYATKIPNLTFSYGQGQGVLESRAIAIRGIQGAGTTGFYVDDLPLPTTMDPRVVDLERIEVLRGPQGTLYGAGSMGGTVRLITTPPDLDGFGGQAHADATSVDGGGNGGQGDGTINIPLWSDRAALRLTAYTGQDGGFINRVFPYPDPADPIGTHEVKNVARTEFDGASVSVLWKVTDDFVVRPLFMYELSTMNGLPEADRTPDDLTEQRTWNVPENTRDRWTIAGVSMSYSTPVGELTSATSVFDRQAYEVEDVSEFTAAAFEVPPIASDVGAANSRHSVVEELRFATPQSAMFQFVGGVYYSRQILTFSILQNVPGLNAASGGAFGTDLIIQSSEPQVQRQSALFGELTYHMTDQWSVTLGDRYSRENSDYKITQSGIIAAGLPSVMSGDQSANGFTPKAVLKYAPNSSVDYYLLASKGFRLGGAQVPPPPGFSPGFCGADYESSGLTPEQLETYQSDSLWNYEVGAKTKLLNERLAVNVAAFQIDWTNVQQILRFSCGFSAIINAGKARSRGGEFEVSAMAAENLNLTLSLGYTDARILEAGKLIEYPVAGSAVQNVAPWTGAFSADYNFPLAFGYRGTARLDYSYTDHSFSANNNPADPRLRQAYELTNVHFGIQKNAWSYTAFVTNVFDVHANLGDAESEAAEAPGRPRFLINAPRTYGLEARVKF
jgi:iron complex outermembrane recepter protein